MINVRVSGRNIIVSGGTVRVAVDDLLARSININEARKYLIQQELERERIPLNLGYIDFDNLTDDGKPTIVGEFYRKTISGRKILGEWPPKSRLDN